MMKIKENLIQIQSNVERIAKQCGRNPNDISIVAVSKNVSVNQILEAYECGCRDFGENRVQELLSKQQQLPKDIRWHFIGALQSNKITKLIGNTFLIHSVSDIEIAKKISQLSIKKQLVTSLLIQANTSGELTKGGLSPQDWKNHAKELFELPNLKIEGLMTMAPLIEDQTIIKKCFSNLAKLRDDLQNMGGLSLPALSMGMSQDYPIAITEGATWLRIGTALFKTEIIQIVH